MARVLIIGDTHCPGMRRGYVDFLKRVADDHNINRMVHIGDLVDWVSISFHDKSPALSNATQELENGRRQIATLARAYQQVGSVRKAAAFLSERTGQAVTKDKIQDALRRSGGIGAVVRKRNTKPTTGISWT